MLEQSLSQHQKIRQEQTLSSVQYQSLEILTASLLEVEQKINQELAENPTLEVVDNGLDQPAGNPLENTADSTIAELPVRDDDGSAEENLRNQLVENLIQLREKNYSPPQPSSAYNSQNNEEDEERYQHFWDSLVSEKSFEDQLYDQLNQTEGLTERQRTLCQEIIGSIDHSGYLRSHLADIATTRQATMEETEQALRVVQSFDPPGIGARDLRECLLLQLERQNRKNSLAWKVVDKHLPEIERNKLQTICKKLRLSIHELKEALEEIRRLNPHPGNMLDSVSPTEYIVPEVTVELDEDSEPQIQVHQEHIPKLRIADYYLRLLQDPETSKEAKDYIREKINGSKSLLKMLEHRERTIVRIARALVKLQYDFFTKGLDHLAPLKMSQVAEELDLHETTVSRAIANKYILTPYGLFPFRFFFASGHQNDQGEAVSSRSLKMKIKEMISEEDRSKPLTDKQLVEALQKEGYKLARRTIAKYREELNIPSSSRRQQFIPS